MKVFVSVGTHPQQFDRLLKELDKISEKTNAFEFFAQTGNSDYKPANFQTKIILDEQEYLEKISQSDLIVSHGGAGTIINCLKQSKKVVVVPRLKRFGEHTNNHQLDVARALSSEEKVISVEDITGLESALKKAVAFKPSIASNKEKLVKRVLEFIDSA